MSSTTIVTCSACGQRNRVLVGAQSNICGSCKAALAILSTSGQQKSRAGDEPTDQRMSPKSSTSVNRWKIFGLTVTAWLGFSVLARLYVTAMADRNPTYSIIDAQSVVWSWAGLVMGIVLASRMRRWQEAVWGLVAFVVCLLPILGMFVGIGYFAWSFAKLERHKAMRAV